METKDMVIPAYNHMQAFSSFKALHRRTEFPGSVHSYLTEVGITGMVGFLSWGTNEIILRGHTKHGLYSNTDMKLALNVLKNARDARRDIMDAHYVRKNVEDEEMEEMAHDYEEGVKVNAERNEMVALLQAAKGAKFVRVQAQPSSIDVILSNEAKMISGRTLIYKVVDLELAVGDYVLIQFRNRLGIARVVELLTEVPTSNEYDWTVEMKHVIQKLDVRRSAQLTALDKNILKAITNSEAQDRLERLTRQLGIAMDQITLALPQVDDDVVDV